MICRFTQGWVIDASITYISLSADLTIHAISAAEIDMVTAARIKMSSVIKRL